ncbi:hypothetical protein JAAARDRAFT_75431 [Jaapia argillacea MUCL 33604]|uniref:Uncharacterized protein n=1 Tax=Jaapia argillacea MUCL 33604 TaxID=933084 RepID=A0A067QQV8_9AGAM|nr:hypothetical protein JAAARDRAFT_75431 [Jaapia argillacea MUCL 33604]
MSSAIDRRMATEPPIYHLPVEILAIIFTLGQSVDFPQREPKSGWDWDPSVRGSLSLVSRHFREIITNTPSLWSKIRWRLSSDPLAPPEEFLVLCLQRSASSHISWFISLHSCDKERANRLGQLVAAQLYRLRELHIHVVDFVVAFWVYAILRDYPAPVLEYYGISGRASYDFPIFSGGAPQLRSIDIVAYANVSPPPSKDPLPPFNTVTTLWINQPQRALSPELVSTLTASPVLTSLRLSVCDLNRSIVEARIPTLTHLIIEGGSVWPILLSIQAPALEVLSITDAEGFSDFYDMGPGTNKLPNLRSLSIRLFDWENFGDGIDHFTTSVFKQNTPLLAELSLYINPDDVVSVLDDLGCEGWPRLQSLSIPRDTPTSAIRTALQRRINAGQCIQQLIRGDLVHKVDSSHGSHLLVEQLDSDPIPAQRAQYQ